MRADTQLYDGIQCNVMQNVRLWAPHAMLDSSCSCFLIISSWAELAMQWEVSSQQTVDNHAVLQSVLQSVLSLTTFRESLVDPTMI